MNFSNALILPVLQLQT